MQKIILIILICILFIKCSTVNRIEKVSNIKDTTTIITPIKKAEFKPMSLLSIPITTWDTVHIQALLPFTFNTGEINTFLVDKPIKGATGDQGITGIQGPAGIQGIQGIAGINGTNGVTGQKGDTGPKGTTGNSGLNGLPGAMGPKGATGTQGIAGINGTNGINGITGQKGDTGPKGDTGAKGDQGITGTITNNPVPFLEVQGMITSKCLKITGGCDDTDGFNAGLTTLPAGTVVSIGDDNKIFPSFRFYDKAVVGVVTTSPGTRKNNGDKFDGTTYIVQSGRTLCNVIKGIYRIGDLLTTSNFPGYATIAFASDRLTNLDGVIIGKVIENKNLEENGQIMIKVSN